jgi:hypothetical protein
MRRSAVAAVLVVVLAACQTPFSHGATTSTVPVTTLPPATSTTVAYPKGAAVRAWSSWLANFKKNNTVSASLVSKSECGVYAALVADSVLTFYWWDGIQWHDVSNLLGAWPGSVPTRIDSIDATNDGVIDFVVTFSNSDVRNAKPSAGIFGFPWGGDDHCTWRWMDISTGNGLSKSFELPQIDVKKHVLYGSGYVSRRYSSFGIYQYQSSSNSFVFEQAMAPTSAPA